MGQGASRLAAATPRAVRDLVADAVGDVAVVDGVQFKVPQLLEACAVPADAAVRGSPSVLYEVVRVHRGSLLFAKGHFDRLAGSVRTEQAATVDGFMPAVSADSSVLAREARAAAESVMMANGCPTQNVMVRLFRRPCGPDGGLGVEGPTPLPYVTLAYLIPSFYPPEAMYTEGAYLEVLEGAARHDPNAKIVQGEMRARAKELQQRTGAFEALLCSAEGVIPEGSRSNYLLVFPEAREGPEGTQGWAVHIAPDSDILVGLTLAGVLQCCGRLGLPVVRRTLRREDVMAAPAAAMLGTSVGVLPVQRIAHRTDLDPRHPVLLRLRAEFDRLAYEA